jgi:hypothetical protein
MLKYLFFSFLLIQCSSLNSKIKAAKEKDPSVAESSVVNQVLEERVKILSKDNDKKYLIPAFLKRQYLDRKPALVAYLDRNSMPGPNFPKSKDLRDLKRKVR